MPQTSNLFEDFLEGYLTFGEVVDAMTKMLSREVLIKICATPNRICYYDEVDHTVVFKDDQGLYWRFNRGTLKDMNRCERVRPTTSLVTNFVSVKDGETWEQKRVPTAEEKTALNRYLNEISRKDAMDMLDFLIEDDLK